MTKRKLGRAQAEELLTKYGGSAQGTFNSPAPEGSTKPHAEKMLLTN